ncbi:MAG: hypothetical protein DRR16_16510 [Candidatus Parabeggiatoa sp. nov. 3]|nr:MAG: hypothetical protein DRR00_21270 [Gammaproteobacteria bacterium]RKZ62938.1 MAG: hypothetical protein DRQ99_17890 [Gammaproteobacteria bacterium]RKZ83746.1 MAG: hypothetical protein DRR16_16510 [Gammaproteobacteria bacterium]HEW98793.1 hypothetical protein [Beggiatoa sp.]
MAAAKSNLVYANFQKAKQAKPALQSSPLPSAYFGTIENVSQAHGLLVKYADKVLPAQSLIAVEQDDIGRRCALMFENGDEAKPLVIGLLWEPDKTQTDQTQTDKHIETTESLILKCGQSSLEMEADGTIRIKGLTITTQAYGANRIKGGSVRIN